MALSPSSLGSMDGHLFDIITKEAASATPPKSPSSVYTASDSGLELVSVGAVQHTS